MKIAVPFILLGAIVLLSFALQTYELSTLPNGFFGDEASEGLDAYLILTNGTDQHGVRYPVFFKSFGDFKSPIGVYSTVPFVAVFGLNEFSVRFASVFFGLLNIVMIYFLVGELFKNYPNKNSVALLSTVFLAISPWHIHMSRIGWEAITQLLFLAMLGLYLFLKAKENPKVLPFSVAVFALGVYCYFPGRIFFPLFGLGLFVMNYRFFIKNKKETLVSLAVLLVLLAPFVHHITSPEGWSRWKQVSIFSKPAPGEGLYTHILSNYASHFSGDFLFLKGDIGMPGQSLKRHSVKGVGELYLLQFPLVVIGLFALWNQRYRTVFAILLLWLALYPLGSAFTESASAQATRSIIGVIPFQIISAFGAVALVTAANKKWVQWAFILLIAFLTIVSLGHFLKLYFVDYDKYSLDFYGWQYGARDVINYFTAVESNYDILYMSPEFNGPQVLIPFYTLNYEKGCRKCKLGTLNDYSPERKQLFAIPPHALQKSKYNESFVTKTTVNFPNDNVAFYIGEIQN
jgi:4-amino-4-deoxy-L-arabinose transferase-like glycosyltransferase